VAVAVELVFHLPLVVVDVEELAAVELVELQMAVMEQREQLTVAVVEVELVVGIQVQGLTTVVEQVVKVSWSQERHQRQEFILQHVVHVHRLHQPMEQTKLQNLKHQQI
jgi:hypothetical protein